MEKIAIEEIIQNNIQESKMIPLTVALPYSRYDSLGNFISEPVLIQIDYPKNGKYPFTNTFEIGVYNPCGVFEKYDDEGNLVTIAGIRPSEEYPKVVAWFPLPKPYENTWDKIMKTISD